MKARAAFLVSLVLLFVLVVYGLIMLHSTSLATAGDAILVQQLIWVGLGAFCAVVLWRIKYETLGRWAWVGLAGVIVALGYLAVVFALYKCRTHLPPGFFSALPFVPDHPTKGSFRWFRFLGYSAQPSELAKPVLALFLANHYGNLTSEQCRSFKQGVLIPGACAAGTLVLVLCGKDLSTTVITGSVVFAVMFVAGVRARWLTCLLIVGLAAFAVLCFTSPERMRRFAMFRNPEACQAREGYQLWHSQLALGSGGMTGLRLTNSRMKQRYLPEAHTDFIVAIIGEEFGYVGVVVLILLYGLLCSGICWTGVHALDRKGFLICFSVALLLGLQALVNLSVVSGFCPTTGVTAPFLSYGGSSMLACFIGIGLVASCAQSAYEAQAWERGSQCYQPIPRLRQGSSADPGSQFGVALESAEEL